MNAAMRRGFVALGRDGMGAEADEADFEAWLVFVSARIDKATGLDVTVEARGKRDVQSDEVRSYDGGDTIRDALHVLWEEFCEDTAAWPSREHDYDAQCPEHGCARHRCDADHSAVTRKPGIEVGRTAAGGYVAVGRAADSDDVVVYGRGPTPEAALADARASLGDHGDLDAIGVREAVPGGSAA